MADQETALTVRPDLPGADLIEQGLADLEQGVESIPGLLVTMAKQRLTAAGIPVPQSPTTGLPNHRLYDLLARADGNGAHSCYNALVGRLAGFARAAEHAAAR